MNVSPSDGKFYVTKDEFQELLKKVDQLTKAATSPSVPPGLPPPRSVKKNATLPVPAPKPAVTSAADPPGKGRHSAFTCTKPGCTHAGHQYEEVTPNLAPASTKTPTDDSHFYEKLKFDEEMEAADVPVRLARVEARQDRILNSQTDVLREVKTITETMGKLQKTLDDVHFRLMENSDALGQEILHVRRDIQNASQKQPSTFRPQDYSFQERLQQKRHTHTFDWEVANIDNLVKTQRQASSHSYLISQLDFKVIGAATCTKDGRMHLRIFGDFTHLPGDSTPRKNARFDCTVNIVDKTSSQPDWIVGKVVGDFNKDKQFMVGDVSVSEAKQKGYWNSRGGSIHLRFDIEIYV